MAQPSTTLILLANLGTPSAPNSQGVRNFLKPFLSDPRVVEVPRPLWWLILNAFILPFRPKRIAEAYQTLWDEYGDSPLRIYTRSQVEQLNALLQAPDNSLIVDYCFAYADEQNDKSLAGQLEAYAGKFEQVIVLPLYPQYSCSTTAAMYDQLAAYQAQQRNIPDVHIIKQYYQHPSFQQALAQSVEDFWQAQGKAEHLLVSYHGVPQAFADKGDPYYQQCLATSANLQLALALDDTQFSTSFQSRLGKAQWLTPYTDKTVEALAKQGVKKLDVICPSFSVDCLETLEEITIENGDIFKAHGGVELRLIPCLNDSSAHIQMMADLLKPYLTAYQAQTATS